MRSGVDGPPSHGRDAPGANTSNNTKNSGSQYALCALGVGLIALGIVMIVWSVVPADAAGNSSTSTSGGGSGGDSEIARKSKASSVAFVLVGAGVVMLLLSMCLGMRNKQRELQMLQVEQNNRAAVAEQRERATAEEQAQRYAVPSYEEAVSSGQYPVRQSNLRPSVSQLPSYDDLVQVDGVQYESEGSAPAAAAAAAAAAAQPPSGSTATSASVSNRRPGKNSRKLLPIKIRRIKSEKLRTKNAEVPQQAVGISIEPLTPPPQYEDKIPPI